MATSIPCTGGKYIVLSEVNIVVTSLRRNVRWASHGNQSDREDPLISSFNNLKNALNAVNELNELESSTFLSPFLEVIKSEDTSGPITGLALSTINKFLAYNLIAVASNDAASAAASMADAVTHARFVGTDPANDEVVLMKILQVLRALLLSSVGSSLTNEAVCEIMQSCFRICFEMRLSELLRKSAEHTLVDMVHLLFIRLAEFKEDLKSSSSMKKLKMRAGSMGDSTGRSKRSKKSPRPKRSDRKQALQPHYQYPVTPASTPMSENMTQSLGMPVATGDSGDGSGVTSPTPTDELETQEKDIETIAPKEKLPEETLPTEGDLLDRNQANTDDAKDIVMNDETQDANTELPVPSEQGFGLGQQRVDSVPESLDELDSDGKPVNGEMEYVGNPRGVRFTTSAYTGEEVNVGPLVPYGLPCIRELFRFLISLTNPHDRHNSDIMVNMGLSLVKVCIEVSRNVVERFPSLLVLVKDDMCRYLFQLLGSDRLSLVAASLRVSLLIFESMRAHLKFQLESFLKKLMELITNDNPKMTYEVKELSIEAMVQLWHIPGFVTELYLNYDCDYYCSNLFEDLSKLLSKNAFPVSGLYTTHLLSLEALLTVVQSIESRCSVQTLTAGKVESPQNLLEESESQTKAEDYLLPPKDTAIEILTDKPDLKFPSRFSSSLPSTEELVRIKQRKKLLQTGTEYFNQKPKKGIAFLQEQGLLANPLDSREVAIWLRENPWLDKKMIGEYISDRRNPEILDSFVRTFKFEGLRVDESLRMYLEAFRLPGEAPVIQRLLEAYSAYWSESNHHPFMNLDAGFTLAYAVIMLNTDQHNRNVRKQNEPMNLNQFRRNLKNCNGGEDFDQAMLEDIYNTIRNDEVVLPDEQTGPVRDRWLWNMSIRRGEGLEGVWLNMTPHPKAHFILSDAGLHLYDRDLFSMIWGPTVAALSFVFDKSSDDAIVQKALAGFQKCALISAHFGMCDVFDNLIISLCKYTSLANSSETPEVAAIVFGYNPKAQLSARTAFKLAHRHGDILREGWRNILAFLLPLFRAKLLPAGMVEVEDFVDPTGRISLIREEMPLQRSDSSIFSSFYQFMTLGSPSDSSNQKNTTPEDQQALQIAQSCVKDLMLEQLVTESKFLTLDSLQELIKALMMASRGPDAHEAMGTIYSEDAAIFFLELMLRVVLQNRDRILSIWQLIRNHLYTIVVTSSEYCLLLERTVVGLIRLAIRLLHREDVAEQILASLQILLMIKPVILPKVSRQIAYGLHELLRTNGANIHSRDDWMTCFTMMKCVGAGAIPPPIVQLFAGGVQGEAGISSESNDQVIVQVGVPEGEKVSIQEHMPRAQSDTEMVQSDRSSQLSDRGYTSDSELYDPTQGQHLPLKPLAELEFRQVDAIGNRSDGELEDKDKKKVQNSEDSTKSNASTIQVIPPPPSPSNQFTLQLGEELRQHDMRAMVKSCETLAFLVRDAAHITPENFELCVRCTRTFVEASINGVNRAHHGVGQDTSQHTKVDKKRLKKRKDRDSKRSSSRVSQGPGGAEGRYGHGVDGQHSDDESFAESVPGGYHTISLQLLDLMHTLHTRAASIYSSWAEEEKERMKEEQEKAEKAGDSSENPSVLKINAEASTLWDKCWCPLLQGIARLCCDARRQVRTSALTYLQRALLVHDLQTLTGKEWESCFNKVLFPLLTKLLENISLADPVGMEETRMRGATLLSKVFLQHLNPLLMLPTFTALWLTILDFMDKYMHVGKSDLLFEAIPESLKNMLLVMDTAGIFHNSDSPNDYTSLWDVTWERIDCFLPGLKEEVFKPPAPEPPKKELVAPTAPQLSRDSNPQPTVDTQTLQYPHPVPPLSHPMNTPTSLVQIPHPSPFSHSYPPAGIIPATLPKITPPMSLNVIPPYQEDGGPPIQLSQETQHASNPLLPASSPPRGPIFMGLGGSLVSQSSHVGPTMGGAHGNILMSPTQNFILHTPAPSPPLSALPRDYMARYPAQNTSSTLGSEQTSTSDESQSQSVYDVPRKLPASAQATIQQYAMAPQIPSSALGHLPVTAIPTPQLDAEQSKIAAEPNLN